MDQPPLEARSIPAQNITTSGMYLNYHHDSVQSYQTHPAQATEVLEVVENDPTAGYSLVLQLTGTHGSHQFDKITKTKTVESILAKMDSDGIKEYLDYLLKQVNDEDTNSYGFVPLDEFRVLISVVLSLSSDLPHSKLDVCGSSTSLRPSSAKVRYPKASSACRWRYIG